jgi:hypothetical protein
VALFHRKDRTPDDPRPQIHEFWAWWAEHRDEVLSAADAGDADRVTALLRPAVDRIGEDLDWELSPGRGDSRHLLVVSSGGNTELRAVAERWALSAPPADPDIAYAASRPADPRTNELTLTVDDYDLPLAEMVSGTRVDRQRGRVDVVVHHPLFPLLDQESRLRAAFLALDFALGEDDVERWLGAVEVSADTPIDAIPVSALSFVVDQLRPPTEGGWVMLEGTSPQGSVRALVRRPFAPVDRPLCDTHVALLLSGTADDAAVHEVIGNVLDAFGGEGPHAVLVAYVITPNLVTVHLYVDSLTVDPEAARPVVRTAWSAGTARVHIERDPAWRAVGHLLG